MFFTIFNWPLWWKIQKCPIVIKLDSFLQMHSSGLGNTHFVSRKDLPGFCEMSQIVPGRAMVRLYVIPTGRPAVVEMHLYSTISLRWMNSVGGFHIHILLLSIGSMRFIWGLTVQVRAGSFCGDNQVRWCTNVEMSKYLGMHAYSIVFQLLFAEY